MAALDAATSSKTVEQLMEMVRTITSYQYMHRKAEDLHTAAHARMKLDEHMARLESSLIALVADAARWRLLREHPTWAGLEASISPKEMDRRMDLGIFVEAMKDRK